MEGIILDFNKESKEGLIRGKDEKRYEFSLNDWKSEKEPAAQMKVDFDVEDGKAIRIYAVAGGKSFGANLGENLKDLKMPNVDMSGIKEKFSGVSSNLSANPTMKTILDHGLQNKLAVLFFAIAFFGAFTDMLHIDMLGISEDIAGSSLAGIGIGWALPILLLALLVVTAIGYSKQLSMYLGIASIVLTVWQLWEVIDENFAIWRYSRHELRFLEEMMSFGSIIFVLVSIVLLVLGVLLPKKENPAFQS